MAKVRVIGGWFLLCAVLLFGCYQLLVKPHEKIAAVIPEAWHEPTPEQWHKKNKIDLEQPVVLYFYSPRCGICQSIKPRIEAAMQQYPVQWIVVLRFNSWDQLSPDDQAFAKQFSGIVLDPKGQLSLHWGVRATPTFILFEGGIARKQAIRPEVILPKY